MKIVYVDVVFLVNFFIDYLILYMTALLLHIRVKYSRIILSSAFGGIYSVFAFVVFPNAFFRFVLQLVALKIMIVLCFGKRRLRVYIKIIVSLLSFSLLLGGVISLFYYNTSRGISVGVMMICALCLLLFSFFVMKLLRNDMSTTAVEVIIEKSGRVCECCLLCDSGNLLVDPYNSLPVILLDYSFKEKFFASNDEKDVSDAIRLLPIKTVSGDGFAEVFTPDSVIVRKNNKTIRASVGFMKQGSFDSDSYCGIIPYALVDNI